MSFNLLAAWWQQETNTFNSSKSDLGSFQATALLTNEQIAAAFRNTRTDWGAVFERAAHLGWNVNAPLHAHAVPFGILLDNAFEELASIIVEAAKSCEPDAVLLMLHGSMVSERYQDCEGELIARVRQVVGPQIPIVVTLDPHANVTPAMADGANALVAYRTTPHVDQFETTHRAFDILQRILSAGQLTSVHLSKPPLLSGLDAGRTISGEGPMVDILARAAALEAQHPEVFAISVQAGFPYADIWDVGPSIAVTALERTPAVDAINAELSEFAWKKRAVRTIAQRSMDDGFFELAHLPPGEGPVFLVDSADNPGSGAQGKGTALLERMLREEVADAVFFSIADPQAVDGATRSGVGSIVSLTLQGANDVALGGGPLLVTGTVLALSNGKYTREGPYFRGTTANLGPSALVRVSGIDIVLCTYPNQTEERAQFRLFGIDIEKRSVVGCKATNHFRADLEPLARALIYVDSGGICSPNYQLLPYQNVRRPIWPLDEGNITKF